MIFFIINKLRKLSQHLDELLINNYELPPKPNLQQRCPPNANSPKSRSLAPTLPDYNQVKPHKKQSRDEYKSTSAMLFYKQLKIYEK